MEVEDSQELTAEGTRVPMAKLADGTRPLTEAEQKADEMQLLQYRAAILREREEAEMQEAMSSSPEPPAKKVRIHVQ